MTGVVNKEQAKVGDTILVSNRSFPQSFGNRFVVIKCPYSSYEDLLERTWIGTNSGPVWLLCDSYEIVERANHTPDPSLVSCSDCSDTGYIMLLTSTVKCRCRE